MPAYLKVPGNKYLFIKYTETKEFCHIPSDLTP